MPYDGRAVANFILDRCERTNRPITNLALQKIVYFCHVWSLIHLSRPLVAHQFEAWEFGPVLPYLYREFKTFDRAPIRSRAKKLDRFDGVSRIVDYSFDDETDRLLGQIVDFYSRMRPGDLVELSHVSGGPWHSAWNHTGKINPGMKIEDQSILGFYSKASGPFSIQ